MSPYNEFRLERLRRGLSNAKLALDIWESTPYFPSKARFVARAKAVAQYREYKLNSFLKHHGVGMRIRITEVNSFQPAPYDDHPLYHFGVAVGDEFEVVDVHGYGFMVETGDGPLFIRRSECEVLED